MIRDIKNTKAFLIKYPNMICWKCEKPFKQDDSLMTNSSNGRKQKCYHKKCYEAMLH